MRHNIDLGATYLNLRDALEPLGISVGRDVIDLWLDREHHGRDALPPDALKNLAELTARLVEESPG
jgi:hypothetical protein